MAALPDLPVDDETGDDTATTSAPHLTVVPPTGGTGHNPNLATLAQVRSHRRNALMPKSHRRGAAACTGR